MGRMRDCGPPVPDVGGSFIREASAGSSEMAQRWWRAAAAVAAGWGLSICGGTAEAASAPPVVPGYHVLKDGKADPAALGELLLGELNCTSCHTSDAARVAPRGAPDLTKAGERLTPQ